MAVSLEKKEGGTKKMHTHWEGGGRERKRKTERQRE